MSEPNWAEHDKAITEIVRRTQRHYSAAPGPTPVRMLPFIRMLRSWTPSMEWTTHHGAVAELDKSNPLYSDLIRWRERIDKLEKLTDEAVRTMPDSLSKAWLESVPMPVIWGAWAGPDGKIERRPPESIVPLSLSFALGVHADSMRNAYEKFWEDLKESAGNVGDAALRLAKIALVLTGIGAVANVVGAFRGRNAE